MPVMTIFETFREVSIPVIEFKFFLAISKNRNFNISLSRYDLETKLTRDVHLVVPHLLEIFLGQSELN